MNQKIPVLSRLEQERFWQKVDKTPGHGPTGTCWLWTASLVGGYGCMGIGRSKKTILRAHRISYFLEHRKQPGEACCHRCDNPACVNPAHLFCGTQLDNMKDRDTKGRGGGDKRRGKNNGQHTMPERTCRGEAWHRAHDKPQVRAKTRASLKRFHQEHPEQLQGENNPRSKLTEQAVKEIRAIYAQGGTSSPKLAAKYGVSKPVILSVINRTSWTHV